MVISIIIPIYNKRKYLEKTLLQVLNQSFKDFECILIDDGSTDGSGQTCDVFAAKDPRFRVFHIPNGGVSHARNLGLDHARGKYITFIDADDEVPVHYLQALLSRMENSGADLVIGGYRKFWNHRADTIEIRHTQFSGTVSTCECLASFAAVQRDTGVFGACCAKLFRREMAEGVRFDERIRLAEDLDFYLKLYPRVGSICFDDRCLYRYRQEAENSSVLTADEKIDYLAQFQICLRYRGFLQNMGAYQGENRKILERMLANYLYFCAYYCPKERMHQEFPELAKLKKDQKIANLSENLLQRLVLTLLGWGGWRLAAGTLLAFRAAKKRIKK